MSLSDKVAVATVLSIGLSPYAAFFAMVVDDRFRKPFLKYATRVAFRMARRIHKASKAAGN